MGTFSLFPTDELREHMVCDTDKDRQGNKDPWRYRTFALHSNRTNHWPAADEVTNRIQVEQRRVTAGSSIGLHAQTFHTDVVPYIEVVLDVFVRFEKGRWR